MDQLDPMVIGWWKELACGV